MQVGKVRVKIPPELIILLVSAAVVAAFVALYALVNKT